MKKLEQIFPDDTFIVSYPKSGNTWIRFILSNYLTNNTIKSFAKNDLLPDIHVHADICNKLLRPRIMKSHFSYQPKYMNVIYIVRDPRDVVVSYYFHELKFSKEMKKISFANFITKFNNGELPFGSWSNHVNSWIDNKPEKFLLIKYEDVVLDTYNKIKNILNFLNLKINESLLQQAIQNSSFNKMRELEKHLLSREPLLKNSDSDLFFIRKGIIGDYKNYLDEGMERSFINVHCNSMRRVGYNIMN